MRNLVVIIILVISILTLSLCTKNKADLAYDDAYDYPIKGGTEEWKRFTSHDEMLKACQIPDAILKDMSTAGLVETVMNYPLYGDIYAYSSFQVGLNAIAAQFNGLAELLIRDDAGIELLRYKVMKLKKKPEEEGYVLKLRYLETILWRISR